MNWIAGLSTEGVPLIPNALQFESLLPPLYQLGTWALEAILIALLANALLPGQIDRLWSNPERGAGPRFILLVVDYAVGIGAFAMVVAGFFILLTPERRAAIWEGLSLGAVRAPDRGRALRRGGRRRRSRGARLPARIATRAGPRSAASRGASGSSSRRHSSASSSSACC